MIFLKKIKKSVDFWIRLYYNLVCVKDMTQTTHRGVAQLGYSAWFGTRRSQVRILSPRSDMRV